MPSLTDEHRILVICVGNSYRGDDAVGLHAARLLRERLPDRIRVVESSGEGADLVETWEGAEHVFIVDALAHDGQSPSLGPEAGGLGAACRIIRIDVHREPLPANVSSSTHAFGVAHAVELARAMCQLPPRLVLYGIECRNFETGALLTEEADDAAREAVKRIIHEIQLISRESA